MYIYAFHIWLHHKCNRCETPTSTCYYLSLTQPIHLKRVVMLKNVLFYCSSQSWSWLIHSHPVMNARHIYIYTIYVWVCFLYFARLLLKKIHLESFDHLNLLKHCNGCSFANPFMVRRKAISQSQKFKRPIGTTVLTPQNTELFMNSDTLAFHHHYGENQSGVGGRGSRGCRCCRCVCCGGPVRLLQEVW